MDYISKEVVEKVRKEYPKGCRIALVEMEDEQAPPIGTKGTVEGVDDIGSILVRWDNGCGLHLVYGVDRCRKLESVMTVCSGRCEIWEDRKEALAFYLKGMGISEGSEQGRYTKIYLELLAGKEIATDGEIY